MLLFHTSLRKEGGHSVLMCAQHDAFLSALTETIQMIQIFCSVMKMKLQASERRTAADGCFYRARRAAGTRRSVRPRQAGRWTQQQSVNQCKTDQVSLLNPNTQLFAHSPLSPSASSHEPTLILRTTVKRGFLRSNRRKTSASNYSQ